MDHSEPYRSFIERAARELAALPDNTRTLLSGREFLPLNPHLFEKVRQAERQFALPCARIYDDLTVCYARQQQAFERRFLHRTARRLRWLLLQMRLAFFYLILWPRRKKRLLPQRERAGRRASSARPAGAAAGPGTSVVMLSCNRLPYLRNTLAAFQETVGDSRHELIVVDNGSSDGSVEFLQDAQQKGWVTKLLLLAENQGISAGYNQGFAAADAGSQYFMKLDSDIKILTKDWLAEVVDFLSANPQVGFVALNQVNDCVLSLLPVRRIGGRDVMDYGEWQLGSAMVMSKRLVEDLGCFVEDPQMTFVPDDVDYYVRASRKGYRALYLHNVRVYHQWELDLNLFRDYTLGKPRDASLRLALQLARDYDRGVRPLAVRYGRRNAGTIPAKAGTPTDDDNAESLH